MGVSLQSFNGGHTVPSEFLTDDLGRTGVESRDFETLDSKAKGLIKIVTSSNARFMWRKRTKRTTFPQVGDRLRSRFAPSSRPLAFNNIELNDDNLKKFSEWAWGDFGGREEPEGPPGKLAPSPFGDVCVATRSDLVLSVEHRRDTR